MSSIKPELRWLTRFRIALTLATLGSALYGFYLIQVFAGSWFVCGSILLGSSLFIIRKYERFVYGVGEVAFAIFLIIDILDSADGGFSEDFGSDFYHGDIGLSALKSMAAIYVLVRGLDNAWEGGSELLKRLGYS